MDVMLALSADNRLKKNEGAPPVGLCQDCWLPWCRDLTWVEGLLVGPKLRCGIPAVRHSGTAVPSIHGFQLRLEHCKTLQAITKHALAAGAWHENRGAGSVRNHEALLPLVVVTMIILGVHAQEHPLGWKISTQALQGPQSREAYAMMKHIILYSRYDLDGDDANKSSRLFHVRA